MDYHRMITGIVLVFFSTNTIGLLWKRQTDPNLCPTWVTGVITYQTTRFVTVPCDLLDFYFFPCLYGTRDVLEIRTVPQRVVHKKWVCCPGYTRAEEEEPLCIQEEQECSENQYGTSGNCIDCDCDLGTSFPGCNATNGDCFCKPGYKGKNCELECDGGYFGSNCDFQCICKDNSTCDKTSGHCNCSMPGWTGISCTEGCPDDKYGWHCEETCDCDSNTNFFCESVEGCICNPGFTGENCDQECDNGTWTYGSFCRENCKCERMGTEICSTIDGSCTCKPGWIGEYCNQLCSNFSYGRNCNETCECEPYQVCLPTNGSCVCPMGSFGEKCNSEVASVSELGLDTAGIVIIIVLALLLLAIVIGVCYWKRRQKRGGKLSRLKDDPVMKNNSVPDTGRNMGNSRANIGIYTSIEDEVTDMDRTSHYNSLHEKVNENTNSSRPYDNMKMSGKGGGLYDSFTNETETKGDDYDTCKMPSANNSKSQNHQQYDEMRHPGTKRVLTVGDEYDTCKLLNENKTKFSVYEET